MGVASVWLWLALLAAALLAVCADDYDDEEDHDDATWAKCKQPGDWRGRVLGSLPDYNATALDIYNCSITEVHIGDFVGLPNVNFVLLNDNQIERLDPVVFDPLRKLKGLRLDSNKLREIPPFGEHPSFPDVTYIDITRNLISRIDNPKTFSPKLKTIQLHNNQIEYLHPDIFKGLPDLVHVSLSDNKLVSIPSTLFQLKSIKRIYLDNNLIESFPPQAFHGIQLRILSFEGNKISSLPVNFASEIKTTGSNFEIYFYKNPWNCACLLEFLAEVKKAGVRHYGTWYRYKLDIPQCKFDGTQCHRNTSAVPRLG